MTRPSFQGRFPAPPNGAPSATGTSGAADERPRGAETAADSPRSNIHPTALVDPLASVDPTATVGPFCVVSRGAIIGPDCEIGAQCQIGTGVNLTDGVVVGPLCVIGGESVEIGPRSVLSPGCHVMGRVSIAADVSIGAAVTIGYAPNWRGMTSEVHGTSPEPAGAVVIGRGTVIREHAVIGAPTSSPLGDGCHPNGVPSTVIGSKCLVMARVTVCHDCHVGDEATLAIGANLAGTVHVGRGANVGAGTSVHQRSTIGAFSMVGMGSSVVKDVLPGTISIGGKSVRVNEIGLAKTGGFAPDAIERLKAALFSNETEAWDTEAIVAALMDDHDWARDFKEFSKTRIGRGRRIGPPARPQGQK